MSLRRSPFAVGPRPGFDEKETEPIVRATGGREGTGAAVALVRGQ